MNFYFCETCGKRVTDNDIEQGAARNKKLKGIYCVSCAAGVNTMEMMPVTDVELRDEPEKAAVAPEGTPPTGIRRRLPTAAESTRLAGDRAPERKSALHHPARAATPEANRMVLGIVAGGVITVAAAVLLTGGKPETKSVQAQKSPPAQTSETPEKRPDAIALPAPSLIPPSTPAPGPESLPVAPVAAPAAPVPKPPDEAEPRAKEAAIPDANPVIAPLQSPDLSAVPPPAPKLPVGDGAVQPETDLSARPGSETPSPPAPSPPEQRQKTAPAPLTFQKFQDQVLGAESLTAAVAIAKAASESMEPADKASGAILAACVEQAASAEDAVRASLTRKKGSRVVVTRANGTRQTIDIAEDGAGGLNVRADELGLVQIQEFVREQFNAPKDADARIAAYISLRGDPEVARRLIASLDAEPRGALEQIVRERQARLREPKAAEDIKKFNELKAKNSSAAALSLGNQILKNYAGCKALAELNPPLETQLAEIQSGSLELRNIFLCGAKRLPDGRIELNFDLKNPQHFAEFVNRSLPGWFTDIDVDMTLANDGRWERYIRLGDSIVTHTHDGAAVIDHLGKHVQQEVVKKADFANGGAHRYRIKAGPAGISFQVDDAPALLAPGAWGGGRLKWPGQYEPLPLALKVTGRVDALWFAEMAETAKDRAKFLAGGAYVELKPKPRSTPRPEVEPEMIGWAIYPIREKPVRSLAGWNEVGPSWTTDGADFISPKPKEKQMDRWTSVFWPQALIAPGAELAFEARLDTGTLDVLLPSERPPGQFSTNSGYVFAVISNDSIQVRDLGVYGDRPGFRSEGAVHAEAKRTGVQPGQWHQYQVMYTKGAVAVFADGKQVLETKIAPHAVWPMAFWVTNGQEYRVRNVKIRKLE